MLDFILLAVAGCFQMLDSVIMICWKRSLWSYTLS